MPEIMGPGLALFDADGDGDLDICFPDFGPRGEPARTRLLLRGADGTFADRGEGSGLADPATGMGAAVGDFDGDALPDLFLTRFGSDDLYRNRGGGVFEKVTGAAGISGEGWSASAVFSDYDLDGDLDLYVARYVLLDPRTACTDAAGRPEYCGPRTFPGAPDVLWRNEGGGRFRNVTVETGISAVARRGLGVIAADLTGDGRPDFFVANDNEPNLLFVNRGDGTFRDEALVRGVALSGEGREQASMGIVCEDLDGDLDLDLCVTNLRGESDVLYINDGTGMFEDRTGAMGLLGDSRRFTGFGIAAIDADLDGDPDLAMVNGHVFRGPAEPGADCGTFWNDYAQPGRLHLNGGTGEFRVATEAAGIFGRRPEVGRGLAAGDVDGDGALDLVTTAGGGRVRLWFGRPPAGRHWLRVRALQRDGARDAVGALVIVEAGGARRLRRLDGGSSYLSAAPAEAHFGLGVATAVDSIEVVWPGGARERFPGGPSDRVIRVVRGGGR